MLTFLIILIIFVSVYVAYKTNKGKEEIKQKSYKENLSLSEDRLMFRRVRLFIYLAMLGGGMCMCCSSDGIFDDTLWGGILLVITGIVLTIICGIKVSSAKMSLNELRNMKEEGFFQKKVDIISEERLETEQAQKSSSIFDKPPACPHCGSSKVRISDDYLAKQGAKMLGKIALGAFLGQYSDLGTTQRMTTKRAYSQGIKIDQEYQCENCGHVWKPIEMRREQIRQQTRQLLLQEQIMAQTEQNARLLSSAEQATRQVEGSAQTPIIGRRRRRFSSMSSTPTGTPLTATAQATSATSKEVQELKELLDLGILTQEEYENEVNKLKS